MAVDRGILEAESTVVTLEEVLDAHSSQMPPGQAGNIVPTAAVLKRYVSHIFLYRGQNLYQVKHGRLTKVISHQ